MSKTSPGQQPKTSETPETEQRPHFYGRRKGKKLRAERARVMEELLPKLRFDLSDIKENPASLFDTPKKEVWLEIGFGNGEHLIEQALDNPDVGFIGCEPFVNGVSALLVAIEKHNVQNIRLWPDDARFLMDALHDHCLDRCFILNSDPWPKKKHAKRRFIQKETLDDLHRILKTGAELRMSSDHPVLIDWQLEKTYFHGGFNWTATCADDWRQRPKDMRETRYQQKGEKQGRPTVFLNFKSL